jgi:hypothetical protein
VLWFAPVLIAAATRPLRRPLERTADSWLDRAGDVLIGPLTATWCASGFAYGQNALTRRQLPIAERYALVSVIVFVALVVRYLCETALPHLYPVRLAETDCGEPEWPSTLQRSASLAMRTALYIVVAFAFFPMSWQVLLATAAMAFGVFGYWEGFTSRIRNNEKVYRYMPTGLPLAVLILFGTERAAKWMAAHNADPNRRLLDTFAYVGIPVILSTVLAAVGREGTRPELRRWHRLAAVPLLVLAAHYMFDWFKWIPF